MVNEPLVRNQPLHLRGMHLDVTQREHTRGADTESGEEPRRPIPRRPPDSLRNLDI